MRVCKIMFWLYVLPYNNCPLISCSVASGQTSLTVSSACKLKNAINADEVNAVEINDIFSIEKLASLSRERNNHPSTIKLLTK